MSLLRRLGEPRVSGTLLAWFRRTGDIVLRVNERNMGECLGEVANQTLKSRAGSIDGTRAHRDVRLRSFAQHAVRQLAHTGR